MPLLKNRQFLHYHYETWIICMGFVSMGLMCSAFFDIQCNGTQAILRFLYNGSMDFLDVTKESGTLGLEILTRSLLQVAMDPHIT